MRNYCTVLWLPTIDPLMAGNIIGDYFHFFLKKKKICNQYHRHHLCLFLLLSD
jgi:hypothetical protein